jgi:RNA polymerase sigma-70 factor (ECF subfamily)
MRAPVARWTALLLGSGIPSDNRQTVTAPPPDPPEVEPRPVPRPRPPRAPMSPEERERRDREDARLLEAYRSGDSRAFAQLLARHRGPVYNFCLRMLGNKSAAEDALQEVFSRVAKSAPTWTRQARVTTWLYTIARNHCIDELRKANHRETASLDRPLQGEDGPTRGEVIFDEEGIAPDRGAELPRLRARLVLALEALPADQREVFLMREHAGMAFKEIAEVVRVKEDTAKSRMRYALERLRASLAELGVTREDL